MFSENFWKSPCNSKTMALKSVFGKIAFPVPPGGLAAVLSLFAAVSIFAVRGSIFLEGVF